MGSPGLGNIYDQIVEQSQVGTSGFLLRQITDKPTPIRRSDAGRPDRGNDRNRLCAPREAAKVSVAASAETTVRFRHSIATNEHITVRLMSGPDWRAVKSREDLAAYVGALADDLESHRDEWHNPELEMYLDSVSRWLQSLPDLLANLGEAEPQNPSWDLIARMLYAGKVYE